MTEEKWEQLKEKIEKQFEEVSIFREPLIENGEERGIVEVVELKSPVGEFRLERRSKPKVLDKVFHYSHRPGDTAKVDYLLSEDELVHTVKVYKDLDGEWEEIGADEIGL